MSQDNDSFDRNSRESTKSDDRPLSMAAAIERRKANSVERRKSSERRRLIDPTTCERDYTEEELAFMMAIDQYKRDNRRPHPTWSEVLEVLMSLGYRKVADPAPLPGKNRKVPPKG